MDVTISLDNRYHISPDGKVWSQAGMARSFWERYLDVFDNVHILARGVYVSAPKEDWQEVTGPNIRLHPLPNFVGPKEYLKQYNQLKATIHAAVPRQGAVIMRVGSQIANLFEDRLNKVKYPFGLEVIGDPYEVFAPGVVDHPLRTLFRWHFSRRLKKQCERAIGVAYVTRHSLQKRYPSKKHEASVSDVDLSSEAIRYFRPSTHFSTIELEASSIREHGRVFVNEGRFRVITVGSLAQMYKGIDVLIQATALCQQANFQLEVFVAGEGIYKNHLQRLAESLGVSNHIHFLGQVTPGKKIRELLDSGDLFVLPSRTEGLPRALIEAMARALPCIGSSVGGIPELLNESEMVKPGDPGALARKMQEVLANSSRMDALSKQNRVCAMDYMDSVLRARRRNFYGHIKSYMNSFDSQNNGIGGTYQS